MGEKQASGNNENGKDKQTSKKHKEAAADKTVKLGALGRIVANACRPNFSSPSLTTQHPPPPHEQNQGKTKPPDVFFADDPRMEWLPTYVIGKTQDIVSHVNHWIKTGQLPQTFTQIDLLALVYRGAQGIRQSWFTPRAIFDSLNKKHGTHKTNAPDAGTGRKPGQSVKVKKLRAELYEKRKDAEKKKGRYRAECWETWIEEFKTKLRPQSLLDVNVRLQHPYSETVKARDLDLDGWKRLYKQEYAERKKGVGN